MPVFHLMSLQQAKSMSLRYITTLMLQSIKFLEKRITLFSCKIHTTKGIRIQFNGQELDNLNES